jgi:hypothetical protein
VSARRALVLAASLAIAAGCGSGDGKGSREDAVKRHLGPLQDARVTCKERDCSVVATMHLSSIYSATLVAAPVIDRVLGDPELEDLEAISVTLDDAARQQVFSLRCETMKLARPVTVDTLRQGCHSIFT